MWQPRNMLTVDDLAGRWLRGIACAGAVGLAYFLAAQLSLGLLLKPDGVAVFWPAAGISSGVLIALDPGRDGRWRLEPLLRRSRPISRGTGMSGLLVLLPFVTPPRL